MTNYKHLAEQRYSMYCDRERFVNPNREPLTFEEWFEEFDVPHVYLRMPPNELEELKHKITMLSHQWYSRLAEINESRAWANYDDGRGDELEDCLKQIEALLPEREEG